MKLYMIRHGETFHNKRHILQWHYQSQLTPLWKEQAHTCGESIQNAWLEVLYSSDLDRAYETAKTLNSYMEIPLFLDRRLRERDLGPFSNVSEKAARQILQVAEHLNPWSELIQAEGVEPCERIKQRCLSFINDVLQRHKKESTIWVIAHGGSIGMFLSIFDSRPDEDITITRRELDNTCINIIDLSHNKATIMRENDTSHIEK